MFFCGWALDDARFFSMAVSGGWEKMMAKRLASLTCPPLWNRSLSKACRIDIFFWYPLVKKTWQWKMNLLKMFPLLNMGIFHCYVSFPEGRSIFFFPTYSHFKKWTCNNFRGWRLLWMKFTHSKKITWWFTFDQKSQEIVVVSLLKSFSDFIFMDIDFSVCINSFLLWFIFLKKHTGHHGNSPTKTTPRRAFFIPT